MLWIATTVSLLKSKVMTEYNVKKSRIFYPKTESNKLISYQFENQS